MSAPAAEHFVIDTHHEGTTEIVATAPLLRAVLDTVVRRRPADRGALLVLCDPSPIARRLLGRTDLVLDIVDDGWATRTAG